MAYSHRTQPRSPLPTVTPTAVSPPVLVQQQMPELQRVDSTPSPKAPSMWIGHSLCTLESTGEKHEYWGVCAPRRAAPWDPSPLYPSGLSWAGPKGPGPPSEGGGSLTRGLPSLYWTLASSQCWLPGLPPAALLLLTLRTQCGPGGPEAAPSLSLSAPSPGLPPGGLRAVCEVSKLWTRQDKAGGPPQSTIYPLF